jgi:hypothetical protein
MTVGELEQRMSGAEVLEWMEFHRLEPLPDPYWIGAQIACAVVNSARVKGPAAKIEDFIPQAMSRRAQSTEEMMANLRAATDAVR